MIAYLIGGPLAYRFRKKTLILAAGFLCIICMVIGTVLHFFPFPIFVILVSTIGIGYGIWIVIKSICLTMEIQKGEHREATFNGIINIFILGGVLL